MSFKLYKKIAQLIFCEILNQGTKLIGLLCHWEVPDFVLDFKNQYILKKTYT